MVSQSKLELLPPSASGFTSTYFISVSQMQLVGVNEVRTSDRAVFPETTSALRYLGLSDLQWGWCVEQHQTSVVSISGDNIFPISLEAA